jgi:hypothetical protein
MLAQYKDMQTGALKFVTPEVLEDYSTIVKTQLTIYAPYLSIVGLSFPTVVLMLLTSLL